MPKTEEDSMQRGACSKNRQGLTVLALLLFIIALAVAGFFLVRYLRSRPAATAAGIIKRPHDRGLAYGINFLIS
jgi:flagellar basal body-associated protein FliL